MINLLGLPPSSKIIDSVKKKKIIFYLIICKIIIKNIFKIMNYINYEIFMHYGKCNAFRIK